MYDADDHSCRRARAAAHDGLAVGKLNFLEELFENGGHFIAERGEAQATVRPASDRYTDRLSFQALVRRLHENVGDGYQIVSDHVSPDHDDGLVDLVILSVERG